MKIMSVDYGDRRTGIALSDIRGILASPLTVIKESYQPKLAKEIVSLAVDNDVKTVVIGLPRNMDGSYGFASEKVKEFAAAMCEKWDGEHTFYDERLTTVQAERVLYEAEMDWRKRRKVIDKLAAVVTLEGYLATNPKL